MKMNLLKSELDNLKNGSVDMFSGYRLNEDGHPIDIHLYKRSDYYVVDDEWENKKKRFFTRPQKAFEWFLNFADHCDIRHEDGTITELF